MALTSAVALAVVALALAPSQVSTAAAAAGQPNCSTWCGNVSVPYPFGFGPPHCYWPGFNLTCDTRTRGAPQLLLGDGTLRVTDISLEGAEVRVIRTGSIINSTDITSDRNVSLGDSFTRFGYKASMDRNELVLIGCNVMATLVGDGENKMDVLGTCVSICVSDYVSITRETGTTFCTGVGCCQTDIPMLSAPTAVQVRWLNGRNNSHDVAMLQPYVFVAEQGWFDQSPVAEDLFGINPHPSKASFEVPLVLRWAVTSGLTPVTMNNYSCPGDVVRSLCKSNHSSCDMMESGYVCYCQYGYHGNPYITGAGGCEDIDECANPRDSGCFGECTNTDGSFKCRCLPGFQGNSNNISIGCTDINECDNPTTYGCFGECTNTNGSFKCRCPPGFQGNSSKPNGCVPIPNVDKPSSKKGLIIGIAVGSGAGSILVVLSTIFMTQRFRHMKAMKLKQKYFKQNRGQLLQQLVSQRADIAERMIIPVDEVAKATNNFDKARELGGGGHGIVYKGILSDLHVVAIKKSKISIQKEIDEFINEVAILSQVNHRNVVKLFGCCLETEVPLLVYEFIPNGTLYHHLHVEGPISLSWGNRLRIATETASAISYLHSSVSIPIIHRDIKSSNILIDDLLTSKVSDFGASRFIPMDKTGLTTRVQGTIGYLDPMYFYKGRLTEKSDVYSFGVILVEMLTRKKPFSYLSSEGDGLVAHFVSLLVEGNVAKILDPQVKEEGGKEVQEVAELAASCIKLSGEDRPTMRQVEHKLQSLQASNMSWAGKLENNGNTVMHCSSSKEGQNMKELSRRYSLEQEFLLSARYPR
ncbi:wall-associated receptor kinase 2-like [Phragmites australis]|uniref:wall-associated receptor kinase 2-like n=1 Tax=Phragmites australis TaxID=29695 RepID=UPI002D796E33|nr:wall-associated receptor kinase 2-like [Phragmites australis]